MAASKGEARRLIRGGGVKVEVIAGMVRVLNAQVFARLWSFVAPPELVSNSCLLVMGSEGRGEQILKTDQDNALLLRDGFEFDGLAAVAAQFNAALADFGYPPCPGDIMLTNPLWQQPLAAFRESLRQWLYGPDPEGPMRLAIFFDARCVAGDATLLQAARTHLETLLGGQDQYLARFAAAADQFHEPSRWWTRLTGKRDEQPLDLKKLGTFPIVHGVRALALQHIQTGNVSFLMWRELGVALINGLVWGGTMGVATYFLYQDAALGAVMTLAMVLNLLVAALMGVIIPMTMSRLGRDPAVGASVMITAITDTGGFFIFLGLATLFLL